MKNELGILFCSVCMSCVRKSFYRVLIHFISGDVNIIYYIFELQ